MAESAKKAQHVIRLRQIPYGFFEKQLLGYFSQFGHVKKVRVARSKKGNHTGIAFVEFKDADVAKIASDTMDNYLLGDKRLRCRVLEQDELPKCVQKGKLFVRVPKPGENGIRHAHKLFAQKSAVEDLHRRRRMVEGLRKRMEKIRQQGIDYEFDFERKYTDFLEKQGLADEELENDDGEEAKDGATDETDEIKTEGHKKKGKKKAKPTDTQREEEKRKAKLIKGQSDDDD